MAYFGIPAYLGWLRSREWRASKFGNHSRSLLTYSAVDIILPEVVREESRPASFQVAFPLFRNGVEILPKAIDWAGMFAYNFNFTGMLFYPLFFSPLEA